MAGDTHQKPTLKLIKAFALTCNCGRHLGRVPQFMYAIEEDRCPQCGSTSYTLNLGRSYGPKSKHWGWVSKEWYEIWDMIFLSGEYTSDEEKTEFLASVVVE